MALKQAVFGCFWLVVLGTVSRFALAVDNLDDLNCEPEYVVVGGGCAGGVLASRLAQAGCCVVLMERGKDDSYSGMSTIGLQVNMSIPSIHWLAQPQFAPEIAESVWITNAWDPPYSRQWSTLSFTSDAPNDLSDWQVGFKILGGGSSGNAMVYNRGNERIFKSWGKPWKKIWKLYDDLESIIGPDFENSHVTAAPEAFVALDAFREVLQWPSPDVGRNIANGGTSLVGFYDKNIKDGLRSSVPRNFLTPDIRALDNFAILIETQVTKILFDHDYSRATGVEYKSRESSTVSTLMVAKEVIVSAGPYLSPHLLMKSGIGPKQQLKEASIPVVKDLPGVGKNYKNHLFLPLVVSLKQPFSNTILDPPPTANGGDFIGHWYSDACLHSKKKCDAPDMQTAWSYFAGFAHYLEPPYVANQLLAMRSDPAFNGTANLWTMLTQPESTGYLQVDPESDYPVVHANFLSEQIDIDRMVDGVKKMRAVANSRPDFMQEVDLSLAYQTDEELAEYVSQYAMGQYHPAGTCCMGTDSSAVVDYNLKVYGVDGLRVVDSSIMPRIQNGNPSAPTMLIGYHAADLILHRRKKKGKKRKSQKKKGSKEKKHRTKKESGETNGV